MSLYFNKADPVFQKYYNVIKIYREDVSLLNSYHKASAQLLNTGNISNAQWLQEEYFTVDKEKLSKFQVISAIANIVFQGFDRLFDQQKSNSIALQLFSDVLANMKNCRSCGLEFRDLHQKLMDLVEKLLLDPDLEEAVARSPRLPV